LSQTKTNPTPRPPNKPCPHLNLVRATGKCTACGEVPAQLVVNELSVWMFQKHQFFMKLGPKFGGGLIRLAALYALYKVFSNGGVESLSYVAYSHMIREGEAIQKKRGKKI
jgi:hypothetical protein